MDITQLKNAVYPVMWDSGSYSFLHLEINLKDTASKEALAQEKEEATCFATLVHEYIHYLQNFTTTWGFTNFITYVDYFAVFFGDNILLDSNPTLPLINGTVDAQFKNKNYLNFLKSAFLGIERGPGGAFLFQPTTEPDFTIVESNITNDYWQKQVYISYISYKGELIPINELVLSENMAIVGSYLASGLSKEESKQSIEVLWGPQYHVIYSFINSLFPAKDCLKITYVLCESSLLIVPYNKSITVLLFFLQNNYDQLQGLNEDAIIGLALNQIHFNHSIAVLIPELVKELDSRIKTFTKYKETYEFYKYLLDVLSIFKKGLTERLINNHTYREQLDSTFLNYHSNIIYSPILVFADKQKSMLGNPPLDFVNSIAMFSGVLKTFHLAYFGKITACPFFEEHSICQVQKGIECQSAATDVYGNARYYGCLMNNSLNIIGIKKEGRD